MAFVFFSPLFSVGKAKRASTELSSFSMAIKKKTIENDISIAIQLYFGLVFAILKCFFVCRKTPFLPAPSRMLFISIRRKENWNFLSIFLFYFSFWHKYQSKAAFFFRRGLNRLGVRVRGMELRNRFPSQFQLHILLVCNQKARRRLKFICALYACTHWHRRQRQPKKNALSV